MSAAVLAAAALAVAAAVSWAGVSLFAEAAPRAAQPSAPPPAVKEEPAQARVSTLHEQATSAYHARLFVDDEGVVLITQTGFTTLRAGGTPEEHAVALGPVAARQGGSVVFWSAGKLRSLSLAGDGEQVLATVPRAPQQLLASGRHVAWIQTEPQNGSSIQTLSEGQVRVLHASEASISASILHGAAVYWVSGSGDGSWAIGRVGLDGQRPAFTRPRRGRLPAMLAAGRDGLYFYEGLQRGVRRLSFDLEQETTVLTQAVCSPIAVSNRVVCAQVGGVFDFPVSARAPRLLATERAGPITALAVTDERAYWVAESGDARLLLRSVALPP